MTVAFLMRMMIMERPLVTTRKHLHRPHVLIVTDDASLTAFLGTGLPLGGFWTTTIASGLQVLEVFRLRQFDLLLIDAGLGSFNALELLRRLRGVSTRAVGSPRRTEAPAVLISELPLVLTSAELEVLGVARVLTAPLDITEVVATLHEVSEAWRQSNPSMPWSDDPLRENF